MTIFYYNIEIMEIYKILSLLYMKMFKLATKKAVL